MELNPRPIGRVIAACMPGMDKSGALSAVIKQPMEKHMRNQAHERRCHQCQTVGLTMENAVVTEHHNAHGQHYWKAVAQIGTIFGSEVDGELSGYGRTKEQALERLQQERIKLHESLWA